MILVHMLKETTLNFSKSRKSRKKNPTQIKSTFCQLPLLPSILPPALYLNVKLQCFEDIVMMSRERSLFRTCLPSRLHDFGLPSEALFLLQILQGKVCLFKFTIIGIKGIGFLNFKILEFLKTLTILSKRSQKYSIASTYFYQMF